MSNIADEAFAMNVFTPTRPWRSWADRLIFLIARMQPQQIGQPMGLSIIHFVRWVAIPRDAWPDSSHGEPQPCNAPLSAGYAPVASNDICNADKHRLGAMLSGWS